MHSAMQGTNGLVPFKKRESELSLCLRQACVRIHFSSFHFSLNQAFMIGNDKNMRPPPSLFKTPPYVTASPVITHRKLSFAPSANSTEKSKRFLVLATDGLWDQLRFI